MEVRVGVIQALKELELEVEPSVDRDELRKYVEDTLADPNAVLWLTDKNGREVGVASSRVAYVELGRPSSSRTIGFSG